MAPTVAGGVFRLTMGDELMLVFEIVEGDVESETLEPGLRWLRRDLIETDSVSTEQVGEPDQPGAKGVIGLLGTIVVSITSAAGSYFSSRSTLSAATKAS